MFFLLNVFLMFLCVFWFPQKLPNRSS